MEANKPIVSFDDTSIAFSGKNDKELKWSYRLFKLMNNPGLVSIGSKATQFAFNLNLPIKSIVKKTIYSQFCGGETLDETKPVAEKLSQFTIGVILDYGVEGKETEADFDKTRDELIKTLRYAKSQKNIPFISCKITGLARFALLEKINNHIELNADEQQEKEKLYARVRNICIEAANSNIGLFIDAEESWIQDAIDEVVFVMMREFNKTKAIIFNTPQMYRHDRLEFCKKSFDDAVQNNYVLGLKIVRGAYMEKERKRAAEKNYVSPIQPNKTACDSDYNAAILFCLSHIDKISFCAATHNENSSMMLAEEMHKRNIPHNHMHVCFSQLYGMSDQITYNLAQAGYNVSKYLPYGPVKDVIPYLIRRANENTSVSGQMSRELSLLTNEIKRRHI